MVKGIKSLAEYQVSNAGINQENIQDKLSKSKQAVTDNFESNSAIKAAAGNTSDPTVLKNTILLLPPLVLLNRFVEKITGGAEKNSILTKIANFGDRISHVLHLDNIISDKNGSRISNFLKNNRFTKYFTKEYKAIPKSSIAKGSTLSEKYIQDIVTNLNELKYNSNFLKLFKSGADSLSPETLKYFENIGPLKKAVTVDYLVSIQKALQEISKRTIEEADREAILSLQGKIVDFIAKESSGKLSGSTKGIAEEIAVVLSRFKDAKYQSFRIPSVNPLSTESLRVLDTVASGSKNGVKEALTAEKAIRILDDILSKGVDKVKDGSITSDPIHLSTLRNKLKAVDFKLGETGIGKLFAKSSVKTKEVLTFSGGILGLAFTANAIIQAVKAAKEAPKGEKKSTFMHVLSEQYVGILLFQPSINILYKACGNKYRGMSVEGREALKNLIENTNLNENITKEGIKIAKIQRDLLLKGVDKTKVEDLAGKGLEEVKQLAKSLRKEGAKLKIWEKPLKFIGNILGLGLDKIKQAKVINLPILGQKKISPPSLKGFVGGLGRFLLILMVIQPFIQKPVTKLCHKIFGEPKAYLAKNNKSASGDKTNSKNEQIENNTSLKNNSKLTRQGQETNLIKIFEDKTNNNNTNIASSSLNSNESVSTPIKESFDDNPSAALNLFNRKSSERYIPSIEVVNYDDQKEKELEKIVNEIIKDTDVTIKNVKKVL